MPLHLMQPARPGGRAGDEGGPIGVDHHLEEELQDLIERGPDWNTIETIVVRLNPRGTTYPGDTVQAAEQR
jgi:hypothetical protein